MKKNIRKKCGSLSSLLNHVQRNEGSLVFSIGVMVRPDEISSRRDVSEASSLGKNQKPRGV